MTILHPACLNTDPEKQTFWGPKCAVRGEPRVHIVNLFPKPSQIEFTI